MALEFKVSSLDALPEAVRSFYKPGEGGAFVLDVAGAVSESELSGLKKKTEDLLGEKKKAMERVNELLESAKLSDSRRSDLEKELAKLADEKAELEKKTMTADELRQREYEDKLLKKDADFKAAMDKFKADITAERDKDKASLDALSGERDLFKTNLFDSMLRSKVADACTEAGFVNHKQVLGAMLAEGMNPRIEVVPDGEGKPTNQFADRATIKLEGGGTKDVPIVEAAKALAKLKEHQNLLGSPNRSGGGATGGTTSQGGGQTYTRSQFEAMDPVSQAKAAKDAREGKATIVEN